MNLDENFDSRREKKKNDESESRITNQKPQVVIKKRSKKWKITEEMAIESGVPDLEEVGGRKGIKSINSKMKLNLENSSAPDLRKSKRFKIW